MITSDQSQRLDWYVRKKTDASITITCTLNSAAFNLSAYTFIAEIFVFGNTTAILTPTVTNGGASGILTFSLTDTQLDISPDAYFWIVRTTVPTDNFWFNGQFVVNGLLWDGATTSTASLVVSLGTQNVNLAVTLGGSSAVGTLVYCGNCDLSTNLFPSTAGTGLAGVIMKGNWFRNLFNSTTLLGADGGIIPKGAMIMAAIDNPGQTSSNWIQIPSVA